MHKFEDIKPLSVNTVFLDRDGTVIEDKVYLGDPAGVEPLPGAVKSLALLAGQGLQLFIVTNQSGIGRGYFSLNDYLACRAELNKILAGTGVAMVDEAFCPHPPEEN
jgi:D-glycero-D-manno-heptose 1,7-bisphosphate phosphatase